jgi:hypothetical protein
MAEEDERRSEPAGRDDYQVGRFLWGRLRRR